MTDYTLECLIRHKVYSYFSELNVLNVDGTEENKLPAVYYSEEEVEEIEQISLWDKVKNTFTHKQEE